MLGDVSSILVPSCSFQGIWQGSQVSGLMSSCTEFIVTFLNILLLRPESLVTMAGELFSTLGFFGALAVADGLVTFGVKGLEGVSCFLNLLSPVELFCFCLFVLSRATDFFG